MTYLNQKGILKTVIYRSSLFWSSNGEPTGNISFSTNLDSPTGNHMQLDYRVRNNDSEEWKGMKYNVPMVSTPCHFGGIRWWFTCPNTLCNRRCRKLYCHRSYFICKKCTGYWYDSQVWKNKKWRLITRYFDASDYYQENVKRQFYNGKPTKKYIKYLRLSNSVSHEQVMAALAM